MASVIIKVFNSADVDKIDYEEGRLRGLEFEVERRNASEGLDVIDNTSNPSSTEHFDDVTFLIASQE